MSKPVEAAPWSFSKIKAFKQCPKQFYHERVLKEFPFVESDAMRYGNEFHKAAELYIDRNKPLPGKFKWAKKALDKLNDLPGEKLCEQKMGLTADLEPCGFFDSDVWWRGVADLNIIRKTKARSIDYKTGGNTKWADKDQLELMALAVFAHYPDVEKVDAALFFVVAKKLITQSYTRKDIAKLWEKWLSEFSDMEAAFENDVWNPKTSGLCRAHCPVLECPHNGKND
jgi:RecB family exonuclease